MHQENMVIFDATAPASALSHLALLDSSTDHANLYQTLTDTRKVISKSFPSAKMDVDIPERTEVPNTPTQRSSQLNISSPALHPRGGASWTSPQRDDSMLIEPVPRAKIASKTVLCSVCQHQRLLAKEGSTKPTCQRCQDRTRIVESGKSEIQESPGGTPVTTKSAREGSTPSSTNIKAPALHAAASEAPMPWFESALVASAIKIKQKKIRVSQPSIVSQTVGTRPKDPATVAPNVSATQIISGQNPVEEGQREDDQLDGSKDQHASISNDWAKFVSSHHQESASGHVQGSCPDSAAVSEQITVPPATPSSNHIEPVRQLPSGDIHAAHSASMDRRRSDVYTQYTMRQLARIALVSGNGSRMTTSQILLWIARTFPSLKVGEGRWERSVQACLSRFDEFDGKEILGAQGSKKLYGFSSVAFRTRFEQEYPEFCTASESRPESLEADQKIVVDDSKRKTKRIPIGWARKSAPSLPHPLSTKQVDPIIGPEVHRSSAAEMKWCPTPEPISPLVREQSGSSMAVKGHDPNGWIRQAEEGTPFMPFQRDSPRQQVGTLGSVMSTIKETSFHNVYALGLPSIDIMGHTEKAEKVAQIRARPSRKKYFGSDYRLAHKRRHALADIHDESNGAWNSIRSAMTEQRAPSDQDEDMDLSKEGRRSLREVFDLPDNMIPMNDGHTELAFRDGTLINGRLPRPRNVYKVGKMFGGELTIRTS
ncbi:hypothetical protein BDU57DRAFT_70272 [Ampelomyces quisqualis]|uniref:Fork-head domain-containing protein n=1 Tax=Ampelomyces quisqualis TaxID=50730 RepID=A0A6A5R2Z3_AMPQU|nr:hypothetical protein BDU57DRAFT_70272 [Ampelomyces quisqualis]